LATWAGYLDSQKVDAAIDKALLPNLAWLGGPSAGDLGRSGWIAAHIPGYPGKPGKPGPPSRLPFAFLRRTIAPNLHSFRPVSVLHLGTDLPGRCSSYTLPDQQAGKRLLPALPQWPNHPPSPLAGFRHQEKTGDTPGELPYVQPFRPLVLGSPHFPVTCICLAALPSGGLWTSRPERATDPF
jgi:hypothetical protein